MKSAKKEKINKIINSESYKFSNHILKNPIILMVESLKDDELNLGNDKSILKQLDSDGINRHYPSSSQSTRKNSLFDQNTKNK